MSQILDKIDKVIDTVDSTLSPATAASIGSEYKIDMAQLPDATISWVKVDKSSHFPIQNIPFGVFQNSLGENHIATAIGDFVFDLYQVSTNGFFKNST